MTVVPLQSAGCKPVQADERAVFGIDRHLSLHLAFSWTLLGPLIGLEAAVSFECTCMLSKILRVDVHISLERLCTHNDINGITLLGQLGVGN